MKVRVKRMSRITDDGEKIDGGVRGDVTIRVYERVKYANGEPLPRGEKEMRQAMHDLLDATIDESLRQFALAEQ